MHASIHHPSTNHPSIHVYMCTNLRKVLILRCFRGWITFTHSLIPSAIIYTEHHLLRERKCKATQESLFLTSAGHASKVINGGSSRATYWNAKTENVMQFPAYFSQLIFRIRTIFPESKMYTIIYIKRKKIAMRNISAYMAQATWGKFLEI